MTTVATDRVAAPAHGAVPIRLARRALALCARVPDSLIALAGRFSVAAVFWKSGQTKIEGFAVDIVDATFSLGLPRLSASAVELFFYEHQLPLIPPEVAAPRAAVAEHGFPILLLVGLARAFPPWRCS